MSLNPKPPYHVLSMSEVNQVSQNGYKVVSLFSGCGGSCLGLRMAGFKILYANEFIPAAQETYRANNPYTFLDPRDIRNVKAEEILSTLNMQAGEIDLLEGSPPCAAFSTAGKLNNGWNKVKKYSDSAQRVDDLFFEFTRLLEGLKPKVFIAENVKGLVTGKAKGYFKMIFSELESKGYHVRAKVLNAAFLGVPQARERVIFIGVRKDLKDSFNNSLHPVFPKPLDYFYTIDDAFKEPLLPSDLFYKLTGKSLILYNYCKMHNICHFSDAYLKLYGKNNMFCHWRSLKEKPCPTIKQGAADLYHYAEPRSFTIPELKRICSFPDDFVLTGSFNQQWERLGRAVAPVMMCQIGKTIETEILSKIKSESESESTSVSKKSNKQNKKINGSD